jgi:N-acylneuraminate cytidylyltransferase
MGKPMIALTIEAAIESSVFDRVVISTDSDEIASIGTLYGAEIPFIRSANLSDDFTPVSLATLDALVRLDPDGVEYKYVAQLMANCPLRNAQDIRASYEHMIESKGESQISVTRFGGLNPWWAMTMDNQNKLTPIFQEQMTKRSQDLPEIYCPTGAIWWAKADVLRQEKTFHTFNRTGWEMPWYRAVDIDTEDDWQLAELLMQKGIHSK